MLNLPRDREVHLLSDTLTRYSPQGERARVPYNLSEHYEQFGVVLDDSGLETMLEKLMDDYICPMSRVFLPRVGGLTLDSHHGSVVEYGEHMDIKLALFSSVFQEPKKHPNDFSAGAEIVDARKKKDNACQSLLRTGIAEEGWYIGILSH